MNDPILKYEGVIYNRPSGRGIVLMGMKSEPHLEDMFEDNQYYLARIEIIKKVKLPEESPSDLSFMDNPGKETIS